MFLSEPPLHSYIANMADDIDMIDISELLDDEPSTTMKSPPPSSSIKEGGSSANRAASGGRGGGGGSATSFSFIGSAKKSTPGSSKPSEEVRSMHKETLKLLSDVSPSKGW